MNFCSYRKNTFARFWNDVVHATKERASPAAILNVVFINVVHVTGRLKRSMFAEV